MADVKEIKQHQQPPVSPADPMVFANHNKSKNRHVRQRHYQNIKIERFGIDQRVDDGTYPKNKKNVDNI